METRPLQAEEQDALISALNLAAAMAGRTRPLDAGAAQALYDELRGETALAERAA